MKLVHVVAAVILNEQGEFLLSSRPEGKPYSGYWEFAGGKVEAGESEFQALQRELEEELGIDILAATPWLTKIHHYEHASVCLRFFRVLSQQWQGTIQCKEGQTYSWQQAGRFDVEPMLPANGPILRALSLPLELKGNVKQGFIGLNGVGEVSMGFAETSDVLLLPIGETHIRSQHSGLQLQALASVESLNACAVDGWWWQPQNDAEVTEFITALHQGCDVPIVALLNEQHQPQAKRLQDAGVHIAYCHDVKASLS